MAFTKKEEDILKAEITLRLAQNKLHKQRVLVDEEIRSQHKPVTDAILATHESVTKWLRTNGTNAEAALKSLMSG